MRPTFAPTVLMLAASLAAAEARAAEDAGALARVGTAALEAHRFGEALDAFTRAATLEPGDATHCFGAGIAAFMLGQNEVAQTRLECALARKPDYLPAAEWLADLHYRAGRLNEAIAVYEAAGRRSPAPRELQGQLALWRKEQALQRRFHELRSAHFTVLFDAAAHDPQAREIVERLEAAYSRVGRTLGVFPSQPVTVVLYTREQFDDVTRLAAWSVAAYDGRIRVPLGGAGQEPDDLDRVLSHEFVHAVVAMLAGRTVPAWLNEGLATVLEPAGSGNIESALVRTTVPPALSELHRSFVDFPRADAEVAYGAAARAVRRLIEQRGAARVVALLEDLGRGVPFATAFEGRIGVPYERFSAAAGDSMP